MSGSPLAVSALNLSSVTLSAVSFSHPVWLIAGLLACLAQAWLWRRLDARQHAALARFVASHLRRELTQSVSIARRRFQRGLFLASVGLAFVALAGPLMGFRWEQVSRHGNEIVFALDTSRSMSTPDVKPDRLTRAKLAIDDFANRLDGDAVGLVAFAGSAFLVCPITLDYGAFHESLAALDTNSIPHPGTHIASAIREAQAAMRRRPTADKVLILVTDGEDLEGDALDAAQAAARQDGLKIYTIGVGTANGDLIPVSGGQANEYVKDASGNLVKSRLDETALKAIAGASGGLYAPLGAQGEGFETIYKSALAPMLKHDLAYRQQKIYTQRYQWPLAAALALLLSSLLIGSRRRGWLPRRNPVPSGQSTAVLALLLSGALALYASATPASTTSAQEAYKKGDYARAEREYAAAAQRNTSKPALAFNAGTAAYRAGQFPQAARAFQESIARAPSSDANRLKDQQDAYYNLGNTLYRTGQKTEKSSPQETIQTWTQALKAYDTALQLRADDADSKFNRDLVKRKIEALKKEEQKPPQNQQNPQSNNPQNKQNDGQKDNQPPSAPQGDQKQPPQNGNRAPKPDPQPPQPGRGQQPPQPGEGNPPRQPSPPQAQGKPDQEPPKAPGQSQAPAAAGEQPHDQSAADDDSQAPRVPGQMSREEARELLDSAKGDEKPALGAAVGQDAYAAPPDQPVKDW